MSEISVRVGQMIEYLGSNVNSFAKKLGYNRSQAVYDIINGKANPSYDFFSKLIHSEFSEVIDLRWLLSGKGEIARKTDNLSTVSEPIEDYIKIKSKITCNECKLRERLIQSHEQTIEALQTAIIELQEQKKDTKKTETKPHAHK